MGFEMGHLLKWVTLARAIALGDFQIVQGELLLRAGCRRIYMKQDVVVERNRNSEGNGLKVKKKCPIILECCICSVE